MKRKEKLKNAMLTVIIGMASVVTGGAPTARADRPGKALGDQHRWALDFRVRLDQGAQERPVEVDLTGDWISTISAVHSGEYDAQLELADVHFKGEGIGSASSGAIEHLQQRLVRPFWATYRDNGELLAVHFFKDVDPSDRNLLQMIATETQLVVPDNERTEWSVIERDGAGSYLAIYLRPELNVVVKRKLKYVHTDGAVGAPVDGLRVDVGGSERRFSLDSDGELVRMAGSEQVRIGVPVGTGAQLVASTTTHLTNLRRTRVPALAGSLERAGSDVVTSPILTQMPDFEKVRAQRDERLLRGRPTASILEASLASKDDRELPDRLAAMFRRRPEAIPAAIAILRKKGRKEQLTYALASAGTPAAMETLGTLARDRATPTPVRVDALNALALVQRPMAEAMRIPGALLDDDDPYVEFAARLSSGALARAGRSDHPAEADAIDAALIARYRKAQEVGELSDILGALGNSVSPSALAVIEDALRTPHDKVRVAAARALRLSEAPETDALLSATIASDRVPQVRAAAIFAVSFHRMTVPLCEALQQAARVDLIEYVRNDAVTLLGHNTNACPGAFETLGWVAEHDAKPGVRRLAVGALAPGSR